MDYRDKANQTVTEVLREFPWEFREGWKVLWHERYRGMSWDRKEIYIPLRCQRLKTGKLKRVLREAIRNAIYYDIDDRVPLTTQEGKPWMVTRPDGTTFQAKGNRRKQRTWTELRSIKASDYQERTAK